MQTPLELLALGLRLHQSGDLAQAEIYYENVLKADPKIADAWHLSGVLAGQLGRLDDARRRIDRALAIDPNQPLFWGSFANLFITARNWPTAAECFRRVLKLVPGDIDATFGLGEALRMMGQLDEALAQFDLVVRKSPMIPQAHVSRGIVLRGMGRIDNAEAALKRATQLDKRFADPHAHLAAIAEQRGQTDDAIAHHRTFLSLRPESFDGHYNLGVLLLTKGDLAGAASCFETAIARNPKVAAAHGNLGNIRFHRGDLAGAAEAYRRSIALDPSAADSFNNLGSVCLHLGDLDAAANALEEALKRNPTYPEALMNLGSVRHEQGRLPEAVAAFQAAHRAKPTLKPSLARWVELLQNLCDWGEMDALTRRLIADLDQPATSIQDVISPFTYITLSVATTPAQQQKNAADWARFQYQSAPKPSPRTSGGRIVLGYLSADFHAHATAALIAELFERHDRRKFVVHGYSFGPDDHSSMRQRIIQSFDRFVELRDVPHAEAARRIAADHVDILIDLKGYTKHARPEILAQRPAAVQIGYLGYPGTTGGSFLDYALVDDIVVPTETRRFYSETCVSLPGCYQINDRKRPIAEQSPGRTACGLPENGFVFCDFNNPYKITPTAFDVWMRLLIAVPGSVLWLFDPHGHAGSNLRKEASARGVDPERLVFAPPTNLADHLARHACADLFLDTYPVAGHTTASDALWAGLPLVTLMGETFISRVAASLLHSVGLPEMIASTWDEYEAIALRLARDPSTLAALRERLKSARDASPAFDAEGQTRAIEAAYLACLS